VNEPECLGRKRRTSGLNPASRAISHPVATPDLRGQVLAEDGQVFAIGRANVRGKVAVSRSIVSLNLAIPRIAFTTVRGKPEQVRKLACCQPRELAAVVKPTECQASIALNAVPAQARDVEGFAAHGLDGITEDRLDLSDFCEHARSEFEDQRITGAWALRG